MLRATGIEYEAELPYGALHQLLRPLEDRIDTLAEPQARALRGALGLAHERDADAFLVGVGVLTLLADAAEEQPLLAVLDDAAWFDHESAHALGFTARRLRAEGVVLLFGVRDEPARQFELPGVDVIRVQRLADDDARRLLGEAADERIVARAAGNPLALLELAGGHDGTEQAFAARARGLPEGTQTLLLLAAADTTTSLAVIGAAARPHGLDETALEPAETVGLVRAIEGRLEFRHPLVRSAVYHAAPFAARARAHRTLAEVLTGEQNADRRAWHHAAGVLGTDEEAAAELEGTAGRAIERSGHAAARRRWSGPASCRPTRPTAAAAWSALRARPQWRASGSARWRFSTASACSPSRRGGHRRRCCAAGSRPTTARGTRPSSYFMEAVRVGPRGVPPVALIGAVRATEVAGQVTRAGTSRRAARPARRHARRQRRRAGFAARRRRVHGVRRRRLRRRVPGALQRAATLAASSNDDVDPAARLVRRRLRWVTSRAASGWPGAPSSSRARGA